MTDPRELGLPPLGPAPSFAPSMTAMASARRRHQHRRRTRTAYTGAAAVAVAAAVFAAQLGDGTTSVLEQNQPAVHPTLDVTSVPSSVVDSPVAPADPLDASAGNRRPGRPPTVIAPAPVSTAPHYEATPWKRADVAAGWQCGATSVTEWTPTGWCFEEALPNNIRAGHRTRLDVRVCRTGVEARELQFPTREQAVVRLFDQKRRRVLWTSTERPSPFAAGERVLVSPGRCVQWTTVWNVRAAGQPLAPGTYQYQWSPGTGLTSPTGSTDHQLKTVKVVAK